MLKHRIKANHFSLSKIQHNQSLNIKVKSCHVSQKGTHTNIETQETQTNLPIE